MDNNKIIPITKSTEELKTLISENPDLPIVVLASHDGCYDEYYWTYCSRVTFSIGEYMSYDVFGDDYIFSDREEFEEKLRDTLADEPEYESLSEQEFDTLIEEKLKEYEPYWVKAIFICADN